VRYGSVCSGIEAATVAWHSLNWQPRWFSEIEPFPSAVLKHHYPTVPNYGDMTKFEEWPDESIDLLVGGTPCQSFSVAGLRKGLADPRGNLMLTYLAIAQRHRPQWLVWENVPGVLSSNGGRDFGTFLGALGELGYGWAYRVLDAQWFGVAQRRRRVFVVGYLGDWRHPAKVLFESESVRRNPAPSRKKGEGATAHVDGGVELCGPLNARDYKDPGTDGMNRNSAKMVPIVAPNVLGTLTARMMNALGARDIEEGAVLPIETGVADVCPTLGCELAKQVNNQMVKSAEAFYHAVAQPIGFGAQMSWPQTDIDLMQTLQAKNPMAVAQPIPYDFYQITAPVNRQSRKPGDPCHTLARDNAAHAMIMQPTYGIPGNWIGRQPENGGNAVEPMHDISPCLTKTDRHGVAQPVAMGFYQNEGSHGSGDNAERSPTLKAHSSSNLAAVATAMQVRRLTPVECERLQGFPDGYTNIPWRNKPESPDGPRYKALGNSMAVPVMRWIGERIAKVNAE
jgi:DNA (cytosine-5)-methyltransferase 1